MADITDRGNDHPDNTHQASAGTKEVIVLEPGDEQAQKIAKAMGSQTAADILQLLKSGPKTSTEVTGTLNIPMGTAKYHIENLLDAGLIEVTRTKYSVKGREVKVYGLKDQLLIVTPRVANVRSLLLKYASLFGVVIIGTAVIGALLQMISTLGGYTSLSRNAKEAGNAIVPAGPVSTISTPLTNISVPETGAVGALNGGHGIGEVKEMFTTPLPSPAPSDAVYSSVQIQIIPPQQFPVLEIVIAFFLGGCLVIAALLIYDICHKEKDKG